MEHPRTTSARDHDDRDLIESLESGPSHAGRYGGNLQRDVATQAELEAIADPDGKSGVTKQDAIDHAAARRSQRARGA